MFVHTDAPIFIQAKSTNIANTRNGYSCQAVPPEYVLQGKDFADQCLGEVMHLTRVRGGGRSKEVFAVYA